MSSSNYCFLTCIQVYQETGQVVWCFHLFENFPQFVVIHTVKVFGIVSQEEVDDFFWNSLAFLMMQQMLAIWSLVPLPFLKPAWTSGSLRFTYYWSLAWRILNITSLWDECNYAVVWAFFGIAFLWDWNENNFSSPVATAEFSKFTSVLSVALSQHHRLGFEIAQLEFHHLH